MAAIVAAILFYLLATLPAGPVRVSLDGVAPDLMRRTVEIHQRMYREWPELAQRYRDALPEITSPEQWRKTFDAAAGQQG